MKKLIVTITTILFIILVSCSFTGKVEAKNKPLSNNIKKNAASQINYDNGNKKINSRGLTLKSARAKVYYTGKAVVLTYHHISSETTGPITIKPERFEKDLKMLKDMGFNVISLRELVNAMDGVKELSDNAVVISFDDGIESFYKYAYPLLKNYNMPAVNFIITTRTESYKPSNKDMNPLSPDEIREMYQSGLIDIQSHSHDSHEYVYVNSDLKKGAKLTHRIYNRDTGTMESEEDYLKRITEDLNKSREIIYNYTGQLPDMLCFPFGSYSKTVVDVAKECGFRYFITTTEGVNKQGSKSPIILRIRSGDSKLDSEKLFSDIVRTASKK